MSSEIIVKLILDYTLSTTPSPHISRCRDICYLYTAIDLDITVQRSSFAATWRRTLASSAACLPGRNSEASALRTCTGCNFFLVALGSPYRNSAPMGRRAATVVPYTIFQFGVSQLKPRRPCLHTASARYPEIQ